MAFGAVFEMPCGSTYRRLVLSTGAINIVIIIVIIRWVIRMIFNLTINGSNGVFRRGLYGTVPAGNDSEEVFNGSRHCILHVMVVVALVEWDLKILW